MCVYTYIYIYIHAIELERERERERERVSEISLRRILKKDLPGNNTHAGKRWRTHTGKTWATVKAAKLNTAHSRRFKIHQRGVQWKQGVVIYDVTY